MNSVNFDRSIEQQRTEGLVPKRYGCRDKSRSDFEPEW
jgi:hypothetical protein